MQNYIMVGAGGTGTHLLHPLHAYLAAHHKDDEWMLFILDGDVVEEKNLQRQLFAPGMVTLNKAEAAASTLFDIPHVRAYPEYLSEENISRFIQEGDIVLICADNMVVRKRIEDHARTLTNVVVINAGNEKHSGSVQLYVRRDGKDVTPRIGYLHPEVTAEGPDRAEMTCAQAAALPGGEQTIIANMQAATWMLTALWRYDNDLYELAECSEPSPATWTELQFDAWDGYVEHIDMRMASNWRAA
jgi:molybdopterin/thiamine biosynthesis adenylyltransferase